MTGSTASATQGSTGRLRGVSEVQQKGTHDTTPSQHDGTCTCCCFNALLRRIIIHTTAVDAFGSLRFNQVPQRGKPVIFVTAGRYQGKMRENQTGGKPVECWLALGTRLF